MADYGLTEKGPNPKRLDVILEEMHDSMSKRLGVNTRQNKESLLNHLLTNIADRIAELWEYGTDIYYSQYPASAEGNSLDNALQFGGIEREMPAKSYYYILCTGTDGVVVPSGTILATDTNPQIKLTLETDAKLSREKFNTASVVLATENNSETLSIVLNGTMYTGATLEALAAEIDGDDFTAEIVDDALEIKDDDVTGVNTMVLSENLTTQNVGCVIQFGTEEYGDIVIPNGTVTKIVKSVSGLQSVINVGTYVAGRLMETDIELRKSHIDKIYNHSSRMIESIRSAILDKVQGVSTCAVYENDTNVTDDMGRPPHSVEVVVEGGDKNEIAQQIFDTKAGGISTYCVDDENGVTVAVKGDYDEDIEIRFNRPAKVYVYFKVGVTLSKKVNPPANYVDLIKDVITSCMSEIETGENVVSQKFISELYSNIFGIDYFDILMYAARTPTTGEVDCTERIITISPRERAVTSDSKIGVVISNE
jgi:uncharacterized phage protein gp47/JayE